MQACEHGRIDVAEVLIDAGADIHKRVRAHGETRTAMSQARKRGHRAVIDLLQRHGATE